MSILDYFIGMPHQGCLGLLINKHSASEAGGFDPSFHPCSDYRLVSNIAKENATFFCNETLAIYRKGVNISSSVDIVAAGLKINAMIQRDLMSHISVKYKFLLNIYIGLFCARSVSGSRRKFRNYPPISNFIDKSKIVDYGSIKYFIIKSMLIMASKIESYKQ
jgi:hypothetical protein